MAEPAARTATTTTNHVGSCVLSTNGETSTSSTGGVAARTFSNVEREPQARDVVSSFAGVGDGR